MRLEQALKRLDELNDNNRHITCQNKAYYVLNKEEEEICIIEIIKYK